MTVSKMEKDSSRYNFPDVKLPEDRIKISMQDSLTILEIIEDIWMTDSQYEPLLGRQQKLYCKISRKGNWLEQSTCPDLYSMCQDMSKKSNSVIISDMRRIDHL